jgi:hypothetical protein
MKNFTQLGYTWVTMPSSDIEPLQLVERIGPGAVQQLNAEMTDMFEPNSYAAPLPQGGKALPPELNVEDVVDLSIDANLGLLESFIKIFTGKAGANLNVDRKRSSKFKLNNATRSVVNLIKLDTYLQDANVNQLAKSYIEKLKDDGLYIITEVIKTPSFTVSFEKSSSTDIGIEAPTNVAEINAGFDRQSGQLKVMSANGEIPLTVAVRAARIFFDKPGFLSGKPGKFRLSSAEKLDTFRGEEEYPAEYLTEVLMPWGK